MKKRYPLLLAALFALAAPASEAQQAHWSWARRDGNITYSINPSYARQVVAASPTRVLWGSIQNQRMIYTTALGDYKLQEMDTAGAPTASTTISGKLVLLQARADAAGNWYILGSFYDSLQVGSNPVLTRNPVGPLPDRFLIRLHAGTLALDWLQMIGDDNASTTETFTLDASGIYLSADNAGSSTISRHDLATGARTVLAEQSPHSYVRAISRDASGGIYVLGNCFFAPTLSFGGTSVPVSPLLSYPWYIVRYSATGNYDWHYFLNDITCTERSLNAAPDGVYLSGDLFDSTSIGAHHFSKGSDPDYMLARLDSNGALSWAHQRPVTSISQGNVSFSGGGRALATDSLLIVGAESRGPAVWGANGVSTNNLTMNGNVVGYGGTTGDALWAGSIDADYSSVQHVATDGASVYVTGVASDLSSIDFGGVRIATSAVPGKSVPYLAKLQYWQLSLEVELTSRVAGAYFWPNPATNTINLYTPDPGPARLVDMQGRELWRAEPDALGYCSIDVAGWPRGVYILQQPSLGKGGIFKVVLQ